MAVFKVHLIHVGNMNNKGTQALLKSDVAVIREIFNGDVYLSVSTTDVEGVRRLDLPLDAVLPLVVGIPYEMADSLAKRFGYERRSIHYKVFGLAGLILMFIQVALSVFSAVLIKAGLKGPYSSTVLKHVKECDIVISYSDENFKEGASFLPLNAYWILTWWSMLISKAWDVLIAKYYGKKVVMFPNSVGPFQTFFGRFLSRYTLNSCNFILVREPVSYRTVKSLNVKTNKILTSDITWLFNSTDAQKSNPIFEDFVGPQLGVSPGIYSHIFSEEEIHKQVVSYSEALDEAIEKFRFSVVFLPHYVSGFQYDDLAISKMIMQKMKNKNHAIIVEAKSVEEFKSLLDRMDMVISSKMHPAVLALSGHVPTLCVAYDYKQTGLFESLDMNRCIIHLPELSGRTLYSKISYVWNHREKIRAMLEAKVPFIQENIKETIRFALSRISEVGARA